MTTQNVIQHPQISWTNLAVNTHYAPFARNASAEAAPNGSWTLTTGDAYIEMDGFDHLSIQARLVAGAADTLTLTVESDDGTTNTFEWDETLGSYNSITGTSLATWVINNGTLRIHLHLDDCNGRRFHIRLLVAGGIANSGVLTIRRTKV